MTSWIVPQAPSIHCGVQTLPRVRGQILRRLKRWTRSGPFTPPPSWVLQAARRWPELPRQPRAGPRPTWTSSPGTRGPGSWVAAALRCQHLARQSYRKFPNHFFVDQIFTKTFSSRTTCLVVGNTDFPTLKTDRKKQTLYSMYQKAYIGQEIKKINCDLTKKDNFFTNEEKGTINNCKWNSGWKKNSCQIFREINKWNEKPML